ncbi:major facilitator superfamily domain-containing protein [Chiua virens]|nr:major facilitator superfamily domain-containing protein [Chiua virens]
MSTPNLSKATGAAVASQSVSDPTSCLDKASVIEEEGCDSNLVDEEEEQEQSAFASAKALLLLGRRKNLPRDLDAIATRRSVFDNPRLAPYYWPKKDYENIHRFDPRLLTTINKVLVRKVDWKIMAMAIVVYFTLSLDRSDINQANSAGFLTDLHLTTDDFNLGNTVYHLAYLCVELPSQLIVKRFGPDRCIPIRICLWSIVTLCQFLLTGKASFLLCRTLLGLAQGGFVPHLVLYMSYFYTKTELPLRFACLWISGSACGIVASFLAYGILRLDGVAGKAGWRWLFLIEGLMTFAIGIICFFNMPQSPTQTKAWFRPEGWLTEREEVIMVNKVLRDDPTKVTNDAFKY